MYITKLQLTKEIKSKEPKAWGPKMSAFYHFINLKCPKRAWKEKKKDRRN